MFDIYTISIFKVESAFCECPAATAKMEFRSTDDEMCQAAKCLKPQTFKQLLQPALVAAPGWGCRAVCSLKLLSQPQQEVTQDPWPPLSGTTNVGSRQRAPRSLCWLPCLGPGAQIMYPGYLVRPNLQLHSCPFRGTCNQKRYTHTLTMFTYKRVTDKIPVLSKD